MGALFQKGSPSPASVYPFSSARLFLTRPLEIFAHMMFFELFHLLFKVVMASFPLRA